MSYILGSAKKDNWFIIGSFLAGFLLAGIYFLLINGLGCDVFLTTLIVLILYSVIFDVNHYFPTYYRVFLDKSYFQKNRNWIIPSLIFITIVPLIVYYFFNQSEYFEYQCYLFFLFFRRYVLILGFYHLVKQNWGFMAIYKKSANETSSKFNWDQLTLLSGSFALFVLANYVSPLWFPDSEKFLMSPLPEMISFIKEYVTSLAYCCFGFAAIFGLIAFLSKRFQYQLPARNMALYTFACGVLMLFFVRYDAFSVLWNLFLILFAVFVFSLIQSVLIQRKQETPNFRKWAVLITTLLLYAGILFLPVSDKTIVVMAITLPHNIQYLAFVPLFSRKQYEKSSNNHGIAKKWSEKIIWLFVFGIVFASVFELGRIGSNFWLKGPELFLLQNTIGMFFLCLILHHYYLDAVIWKFGKDESLEKTIN